MDSWLNVIAAGLTVIGALVGLAQYLKFRTKRERQAEVGKAFASVVAGLGSESLVERLANAALLRRFWDPSSEYGKNLPYAEDAVKVAAAILKHEPTGPVQKLIADELRTAPTQKGRSFQRANLRDVYWGNRTQGEKPVSLIDADFYRADLSLASLRNSVLAGAQFREAHLVNAILIGADCTEANFQFANLRGANFTRANLQGARFQFANLRGVNFKDALLDKANFKDAQHVPPAIAGQLDHTGVFYAGSRTSAAAVLDPTEERGIFISAPSVMSAADSLLLEQILRVITQAGALPRQFLREDYGQAPPLEEVTRRIASSRGVLVFGPPQMMVKAGTVRGGTPEAQQVDSLGLPTPWNHVEAGIGVGLGKPVLIVKNGAVGGVFDIPEDPGGLDVLDLSEPGALRKLDRFITEWLTHLESEPAQAR